MKNLKRISLIVLMSIFASTNMFGQDTVYFDTHTNAVNTASFASAFVVDSTSVTDTLFIRDTAATLSLGNQLFSDTVPSTYSNYIVEFILEHNKGNYSWGVDTNSTQLIGGPSFINSPDTIYDTLTLSGGSTITYNYTWRFGAGSYKVTSTIMHTVDTIFFNSMTVGLFDNTKPKAEFTLYPNPTVNDINITFDDNVNENVTFNIFDMSGRIVKQGNLFSNNINVSNLNRGTYFINLNVGNEIVTKRFVKN